MGLGQGGVSRAEQEVGGEDDMQGTGVWVGRTVSYVSRSVWESGGIGDRLSLRHCWGIIRYIEPRDGMTSELAWV